MSESEPVHFSIQELASRPVSKQEREDILAEVREHPKWAAHNLWFQVHNGHGENRFEVAVPLLRELGRHEEYRGQAVMLLGVVMERGSDQAVAEAETAVRGILRNKRLQ